MFFTDLSKAFDCFLQDLLVAKLHAFGFDQKSLEIINAYLNDRIQVAKVGSFYSEILQIIYGVPQGSILGPLLFNINLIDLFLAEHINRTFLFTQTTQLLITVGAHFWKLYQTWR